MPWRKEIALLILCKGNKHSKILTKTSKKVSSDITPGLPVWLCVLIVWLEYACVVFFFLAGTEWSLPVVPPPLLLCACDFCKTTPIRCHNRPEISHKHKQIRTKAIQCLFVLSRDLCFNAFPSFPDVLSIKFR